ncbi:hypothetical protein QBC46DRAFT_343448 [Diplogelasinospora grovesii]|uniref:CBM-cenC domain-containing protein n=1 Tax=Diplogelasinospora grovesii TaxID=303347 RepID=A0AAN6S2W3_9PEZI|nr:hypothetical protein QBC46DRAFT_343448 [Diplogelasinospora grovesii]
MSPAVVNILLLAGALADTAYACAADNCYNQLSRNTPSASSFCATYTTATVTNVAALPTYVSTSCGTARVSSACSCIWPASATLSSTTPASSGTAIVTVTKTVSSCPASTNLVVNGAIPGLSPWYNGDIIKESSYNYNPPQIALSSGSPTGGAFLISFPADGIYELDQLITFPAQATKYTMTFWAQSPSYANCNVNPSIGTVGTGNYEGTPVTLSSTWIKYSITYTTNGNTSGFVALEVQCSSGTNNQVLIDNVSLVLA